MAYRSLSAALVRRRQSLETEQREIDEQLSALGRASQRQTEITNEIEDVEQTLAEIGQRRRLPMLDRIRVASPCNASWQDMVGDERVRFCDRCEKNVYNLSAMTEDEAETLLYEREGRICTRFFRRPDGTILTSDCTIGRRRRRTAALVLFGLAAASVSTCGATAATTTSEPKATMGAAMPLEISHVDPPPSPGRFSGIKRPH